MFGSAFPMVTDAAAILPAALDRLSPHPVISVDYARQCASGGGIGYVEQSMTNLYRGHQRSL
jgi:hypothetical protein